MICLNSTILEDGHYIPHTDMEWPTREGIYDFEVRGASDVRERGESNEILHYSTSSIAKSVLKGFIPGWVSLHFVHTIIYVDRGLMSMHGSVTAQAVRVWAWGRGAYVIHAVLG